MREHGFDVPLRSRRMDALVTCRKARVPGYDNSERIGRRGCHEHIQGSRRFMRPGTRTVAMNANEPVSRAIGFTAASFVMGKLGIAHVVHVKAAIDSEEKEPKPGERAWPREQRKRDCDDGKGTDKEPDIEIKQG